MDMGRGIFEELLTSLEKKEDTIPGMLLKNKLVLSAL
jgi:hypothetical protein